MNKRTELRIKKNKKTNKIFRKMDIVSAKDLLSHSLELDI